jgi:hypothetical protein
MPLNYTAANKNLAHIVRVGTVEGDIILAGELFDKIQILVGTLDGLDLTRSNLIDELGLLLGTSQDRELMLGLESQKSRQDGGSEVSSTALFRYENQPIVRAIRNDTVD